MIKPDLLVSWPRNCDYPLWRQFVRDNRARFNEVIVVFTETNQGEDYRDFVQEAMFKDYVHFVQSPPIQATEDWRNVAMHQGMIHSYNAPWLWFTEEDFYPGNGFWEELEEGEKQDLDVVAVYDQRRMHPCCIFVKRPALEKTGMNFGIIPDKLDHFGLIQKSLEDMHLKIGIFSEPTYKHYNGLSHNWTLASNGAIPNYKVEDFADWLQKCLKVTVPLDKRFVAVANAVISKYGPETTPPDHSPTLE